MDPNFPNQQQMPAGVPVNGQPQGNMQYAPSPTQGGVPAGMPPQMGAMPQPQAMQQSGQAPMPMPQVPMQPQAATVSGGAVVQGQNQPTKGPGIQHAVNPNSTQNMLQVAEIRDGIVIMNDGSFRSVVMVKSINFDLMSRQEQEAVEYNYQNFLNSLFFPIQIFIRSQKVDIAPYLEKLDKIRSEHDNMLLALLMDDYIGYITALAQQTNIMDKKFYIVVPFFPHVDVQKALTQSKNFVTGFTDLFNNKEQHVVINEEDLEKAKAELRTRVQTVLSGLLQSNIQGLPLDTQELIELFYDTYNPDTATRQQLKNFNNLSADVITKGQGSAPQPHLDRELT
jgi:hypothetical protein